MKREFTKNFTENDMKEFYARLKDEGKYIIFDYKNARFLEDYIRLDSKNTGLSLSDFDIESVCPYSFNRHDLDINQFNCVRNIWIKFVFDKQPTEEAKTAYHEAYNKYFDETVFGKASSKATVIDGDSIGR